MTGEVGEAAGHRTADQGVLQHAEINMVPSLSTQAGG